MLISPSLLAADFSRLGDEVARMHQADWLHIDIMDGIFVPNLSMGPQIVAALRDKTQMPFDVHLMLLHPINYIESFKNAGADFITIHQECEDEPMEVIKKIKACGLKAGMALKPSTPAEVLEKYGHELYLVTIMTVEPGFGGQKLMEEPLKKIKWIKEHFPHILVEVDGGVCRETAELCREAGVDVLVAGTAIFQSQDPGAEMAALKGEG